MKLNMREDQACGNPNPLGTFQDCIRCGRRIAWDETPNPRCAPTCAELDRQEEARERVFRFRREYGDFGMRLVKRLGLLQWMGLAED